MDVALALVTVDGGGLDLVPVIEVDGVLVERDSRAVVDLVSLVALVRLPAPVAA